MMAILTSLRKQSNKRSTGDRERQFYLQSLSYLSTTTGVQVELESWTITCFEVDFGPIIGSGGLYVIQFPFIPNPQLSDYSIVDKSSKERGTRRRSQ